MSWGDKKVKLVRQVPIELGKDTDVLACKKLGGTVGSDGVCRVIHAGVDENGDVHLKSTVPPEERVQ